MARTAVCATLRQADMLASNLRAIRGECKKQGLDDDTRRALIERFAGTGKRSSKDLTLATSGQVLDHLHSVTSQPGKSSNEWAFVFKAAIARQPYLKKIYRCAEKIGAKQNPPVKVMSKAWVEGSVKQSVGLNHPSVASKVAKPLETCAIDELLTVIQILESWAKKIGA